MIESFFFNIFMFALAAKHYDRVGVLVYAGGYIYMGVCIGAAFENLGFKRRVQESRDQYIYTILYMPY